MRNVRTLDALETVHRSIAPPFRGDPAIEQFYEMKKEELDKPGTHNIFDFGMNFVGRGILDAAAGIKHAFRELFDPVWNWGVARIINRMRNVRTLDALETVHRSIAPPFRGDPAIEQFYEMKKEELDKPGSKNLFDFGLNLVGRGVADGVWAITEKAVPKIQEWIDNYLIIMQEGYSKEMYNLKLTKEQKEVFESQAKALKDLSETGEFGLNAMVHFILWMTVAPFARLPLEPALEALRQEWWYNSPTNIPSMSDLTRMELREVFMKDEKGEYLYGQELWKDEPPSEDFKNFSRRKGFNTEFANFYWGAHWALPSVTQGYEMYHRLRQPFQIVKGTDTLTIPSSKPDGVDLFQKDDLYSLLKRQDVLKRYRDQLIAVAYRPYTRVDIRRMYRAGVLSYEEVVAAYMDIGYNSERAIKLADFTVKWVTEGIEKRETKADVLAAMKAGVITEEEALDELKRMYPDDKAKRKIDVAKIKNKLSEANVGWLYSHGEIDASDAEKRFGEMGYDPVDVALLLKRYAPQEKS